MDSGGQASLHPKYFELHLSLSLSYIHSLTHTIQLFEELHEKEQNCQSLQNYAGLLLQRITEQSPDLLQSTGSHHEQYSELLMAEQ